MDEDAKSVCDAIGGRLRAAAALLATASSADIDSALDAIADGLESARPEILSANRMDCQAAEHASVKPALLDRLRLNDQRLAEMMAGIRAVRRQRSPLTRVLESRELPNGLRMEKRPVPLGVILFIYESRPNVTTDAAAICLKSGNAVCLRGGREAAHTNQAIGSVIANALTSAGVPRDAVVMLDDPRRQLVGQLLTMPEAINLVIPRGGEALIRRVAAEAKMPVLKHYQGICHVYVDADADIEMAADIVVNSKCQRPGVCNAMETLLVHRAIAHRALPQIAGRLADNGVELRGCPTTCAMVDFAKPAAPTDFGFEFLDLIAAVRVVDSLDEAIAHIARHGSSHTDAIVTADQAAANEFLRCVDSAVVLHNASTRFNDGGQLGLGAEIGISTDKLHARGPCGVDELTSYKYVVQGRGQTRA